MGSISEFASKYPRDAPREQNCCYHQGIYARGICSCCGRDLCYDCFLDYERKGFCPQCKPNFLFRILRFRSCMRNPVSILILAIGLFSILYLAGKPSPHTALGKQEIALRNWLYLGKAARLKLYADYLKGIDKENLAKGSYYRARLALEHVLQETQDEFSVSLADTKTVDESVRQRLAALLISIAACYRGEQENASAIYMLNKSLEVNPGPDTMGLAYYGLGQIYEEEIKDYHKAISMYKAAQKNALKPVDLWENMLDFLAKPVSEKRLASAARQLAGTYDPAEAQHRVISCYRELGMTDEITKEYRMLINEYPFSKWAIEAQEATEIEEIEEETEIEKEEETIKIVPWEE